MYFPEGEQSYPFSLLRVWMSSIEIELREGGRGELKNIILIFSPSLWSFHAVESFLAPPFNLNHKLRFYSTSSKFKLYIRKGLEPEFFTILYVIKTLRNNNSNVKTYGVCSFIDIWACFLKYNLLNTKIVF